jgi:Mn2+/Fe2+ NRAMP family transporter
MRLDVVVGMFASNLVMYFIILTAGATLHAAGLTDVQTAEQAATALRPLAGPAASLLFTLGLIGTGMLGVPVLAGSGAYAVAEAAAWRRGMDETPRTAPHFYGLIALSMAVGIALTFTRINAIRLLFWSAVVNGLFAPPLIVLVLVVCNNRRIMRAHANDWSLNLLGGLAALAMGVAAVALLASLARS